MHFQRDLYQVAGTESRQIVGKLLCIGVFHEERRNRIGLLADTTSAARTSTTTVALRNVLLTDGDTVHDRNCVSFFQQRGINKSLHAGDGQKQAITFFSSELQRLNVALLWIEVAAGGVAVLIFSPQKVVLLSELYTELAVYGEVDPQLVRFGSKIHNYRVPKALATEQTISVGVLTQIADFGDIRTIHLHLSFDFIRC